MWETWIQSLGWEDPLKKGTATHSSILAWRIPCIVVHGVAKSKNKNNLLRKVALFFFFSHFGDLFNAWPKKSQQFFRSASAFNLLPLQNSTVHL